MTSATPNTSRFFVAFLPPPTFQEQVKDIQQYFAERYQSRGAQKSPPHITLQSPFEWEVAALPLLTTSLEEFANYYSSIPIRLSGFAAFAPRVIYINVVKTPELMALQAHLSAYLAEELAIIDPASQERSFTPHITVAFRDLTRQNFKAAWPEFQFRPLQFEFTAADLTLLIHDEQRWNVNRHFPLNIEPMTN